MGGTCSIVLLKDNGCVNSSQNVRKFKFPAVQSGGAVGYAIDNTVQVDTQRARILLSGVRQTLHRVTRTFPNIYKK